VETWAAISLPCCLCLQSHMTPSQCGHPPHSPGLGAFLRCSPGESVPGLLLRDSAGVGAPHGSLLASDALCPEGTVGSALQVCCSELMLSNKLFQSRGSRVWGVPGLSLKFSLRLSLATAGSWAWAHLEGFSPPSSWSYLATPLPTQSLQGGP